MCEEASMQAVMRRQQCTTLRRAPRLAEAASLPPWSRVPNWPEGNSRLMLLLPTKSWRGRGGVGQVEGARGRGEATGHNRASACMYVQGAVGRAMDAPRRAARAGARPLACARPMMVCCSDASPWW